MIGIINGSTRKGSQTNEICELVKKNIGVPYKYVTLEQFDVIPDTYLEGSQWIDDMYLELCSTLLFIIPSYYVLPSPIFLNFINIMSSEQVKNIFTGKTIYMVSVQDGPNLNEIHVDSLRRLFNKMFHYHKVTSCKVCTDFCMVNRSIESRERMLSSIKQL